MESLKSQPYYHFDKNRLLESTDFGSGELYDWPVHMAEKTWVDLEAFIEVWRRALEMQGYADKVDQPMLESSLTRARKEAKRVNQMLQPA